MNHPNDWHLLERDEAAKALDTDLYKGLSESEARRRRRFIGENAIWHIPRVSALTVAAAAIFDLSALLLIISAAAAALFEKSTEAGALILLLVIGGAVRTAAHLYATRILEERARDKIPSVSVIRDGRVKLVSAENVVPGDIVILEPGDTVPCDGRVVAGDDAVVSERGITENKKPVHKFDNVIETESAGEVPCEFRSNMLFAGSLIISGSLRMVATACGEAALISREHGGITIDAAVKLPAVEKLRTRSRNTSLVMLACVMILTALSVFFGEGVSLPEVFLGTMAMAVAAMSEFLTVIATITVAVGIREAAAGKNSRVLIRMPEKLEEIRDIRRVVFCGSSFFKSGRSELYSCRIGGEYKRTEEMSEDELDKAAELIALAMTASADSNTGIASGNFAEINNTDMDAVIRRASCSAAKKSKKNSSFSWTLYDHADAGEQTSGLQLSLIEYNGDICAVGVGKAGDVLACCTSMEENGETVLLTDEMRRKILTECVRLEFGGASVLAVAMRSSPYLKLSRPTVLAQFMTFRGFFAVAEEPEKNAKKHISEMKKKGIVPIMFTEHPEEDLYYCHRLGLFSKNTVRVNADELTEEMVDSIGTDGGVISFKGISRIQTASAYAGAMKKVMYNRAFDTDRILQEECEAAPVTAAIGRETRDSGVLASADVGIAVSKSDMKTIPGTLSTHAALLVRNQPDKKKRSSAEAGFGGLDGALSAKHIVDRMFAGIEAAKYYLTASQCARLIVMLGAVVFGIPFLSAVNLLVWGLLFDFAGILVMAFAAPEGDFTQCQGKKSGLRAIFDGFVWGAASAVWCRILMSFGSITGITITYGEVEAILSASVVLSGCVNVWFALRRAYSGCRVRFHSAGAMFFSCAVIYAAVLTMTDIPVMGAACCGLKSLLALVPLVMPLFTYVAEGLVSHLKDRGNSLEDS